MKNVITFVFLMFVTASSNAFSLDNSDIRLLCPQRGQVEVVLHRYQHTQESWGNSQFETGGGHSRAGQWLIIEFANMDQMIYNQATRKFSYWYADTEQMVNCQLLSVTDTHPVNIPYYREN
ncbi:hypothetical protein [Pantoea agglomerans]|uniref:hypothetical protein n=1 Tax=Enterobacter agglomerans TaxID=549 RepID=UPI0013BD4F6D|nr:hypothetical protein [Pantoea agglomerans]NEG58176.1 hypothetical protein [Pantoea agglomerans]NEG99889.1 hypothetical protein [Pantoea agglomerans]NEH04148.1 hypothetical protein [Pantoea agglomerans]NEH14449.1 hypothetical protein [Pantoea agglomerans]